MPFNPAQFVFQPRPLQQFDFGAGFRDLAEGRMQRARMAETTAQRQDTNSLNAANFAKDRNNTEYDKAMARYQEREKLIDAARLHAQSNRTAEADALIPSITELGGVARKEGNKYYFEAGPAPTRNPLDIQGARRDIYGGGGPTVGQPFQMRSPSSPGGELFAEQNPFDAPATPGASAAAAAPYPGRSGMQPPEGAEVPPEAAPQATEQPPQLPPNPFEIDMAHVVARNNAQLDPILQGFNRSIPAGPRRDRISSLTGGIGSSGFTPEAALKLGDPLIKESVSLMRSEDQAAAARASMGLRQQGQEFSQMQRNREHAEKRIDAITKNYKLPDALAGYKNANDTLKQIDSAERGNGSAATQAVVGLVSIKQGQRISDSDFKNASKGAFDLWSQLGMVAHEAISGGFNPYKANAMREVIAIYRKSIEDEFLKVQRQMLNAVRNPKTTAEEADMYLGATAQMIPEEYWDPMVRQFMGVEDDGGAQASPPAGDTLGTAPLPRTLDGTPRAPVAPSPRVSPNGVPLERGSRVPEKPPAKAKSKYDGLGLDPKTQKTFDDLDEEGRKLGIEL